jgi:uncharacterized protein
MNVEPAPNDPFDIRPETGSADLRPDIAIKYVGDQTSLVADNDFQPPEADIAPPPLVECRRCGKQVAGNLATCPYCEARLRTTVIESFGAPMPVSEVSIRVVDDAELSIAITRLLVFYLVLLGVNLIGHWVAQALMTERIAENRLRDISLYFTICIEAFDAAIVFIAIASIPKPPRIGPATRFQRNAGALAAPFILAIALGLNFGYHALLQDYVQFPVWVRDRSHMPIGWAIVLVCVQPGIIEELFFRYLALGTLMRVMGVGAALCVSSLMFGMAHSGVLLSIPILTVVGFCLGVVRVWSGSLILPMLLHALHNAVVLYLEVKK